MSTRMDVFLFAVGLFLFALLATGGFYLREARRRAQQSWPGLLKRLKSVNRENIARVALDCDGGTPPRPNDVDLHPSEIWEMVGGMNGLLALEANCDVLIDMAAYVQTRHPEAVVIAEELRTSARQLKWHVSRLQGAKETGKLDAAFPSYAQRAVLIYYQMTQSLLGLYEWTELPETAALKAAL